VIPGVGVDLSICVWVIFGVGVAEATCVVESGCGVVVADWHAAKRKLNKKIGKKQNLRYR
jgi:hypothetical protein